MTNNNASNNYCGIWLNSSSNSNTLTSNTANNNWEGGIVLSYSSNSNTLTSNNANYNRDGILLSSSSNNILTNNNANYNVDGIWLSSSSNNTLTGNNAENNDDGIRLFYSSNNTLTGNKMSGNRHNFCVLGREVSDYIQKIERSNTVERRPVIYWVEERDKEVPSDAGYVGIVKSKNITVRNLTLTNNSEGVLFVNTADSRIENVTASNNWVGILLSYSSNNSLTGNNAENNDDGILLYSSSNNSLSSNTANNNDYGIELYSSSGNFIYNNYFNNTNNAYDDGNNTWNITKTAGTNIIGGPYLGGNYWSDYKGFDVDEDGIGDWQIPYNCSGEIIKGGDYLPLVNASVIPVILVHGWRPAESHGEVATWSTLKEKLKEEGINCDEGIGCYEFDYSPGLGDPRDYAGRLKGFIEKIRADTGYTGKFDIVCHSMGALVSRWYIEELGGAENIRQWIGIAPVNHGAAVADKFDWMIPDWLGWAFPGLFGTEKAIDEMHTDSPTVTTLNGILDGAAQGVKYRVVVGVNSNHNPKFGGVAGGRTWVKRTDDKGKPCYPFTYQGDGVVALEQSRLEGAGTDCFEGLNHNKILHNAAAVERVTKYLLDPSKDPLNNCPTEEEPGMDDHAVIGVGNQGNLRKGEYKPVKVPIDSSVEKASATLAWSGSELNLTLITPTGETVELDEYPVIEFVKGNNSIWIVIDAPESGIWTARIDAVDVPEGGENYSFATFYSTPLTLGIETGVGKNLYNSLETVTVRGYISENGTVLCEPELVANLTAEIKKPDGAVEVEVEVEDLILYDDGLHNDCKAKDGIFGNTYDNTTASGTYDIVVTASGTADSEAFKRIEIMTIWVAEENIFDTGAPANPYPSLAGTHNGTLTPSRTITVNKLYTYPCVGTGGHSEYARVWNSSWNGVEARWSGYAADGDWQNLSFNKTFTLLAGETYNYTVRTGSYPQIHHTTALRTANGWLNCSEFIDANGKVNNNRIPAIKLF